MSKRKKGGHEPHTQETIDVHCGIKHSLFHVILESARVISKIGEAGVCSALIPSTGTGPGS